MKCKVVGCGSVMHTVVIISNVWAYFLSCLKKYFAEVLVIFNQFTMLISLTTVLLARACAAGERYENYKFVFAS